MKTYPITCPSCNGRGSIKNPYIEQSTLTNTFVTCSVCGGNKWVRESMNQNYISDSYCEKCGRELTWKQVEKGYKLCRKCRERKRHENKNL